MSEVIEIEESAGGRRVVVEGDVPEAEARKIRFVDADGDVDELVLCRFRGRLYALNSLCPHEGGRLAAGPLMENRYAFCPLHLYKFDPITGAAVEVDCPPARTYPVIEEEGRVVVRLDEHSDGS